MARINFKKLQAERPEPTEDGEFFPRDEVRQEDPPQEEPQPAGPWASQAEEVAAGVGAATSRAPRDSLKTPSAKRHHQNGMLRSDEELTDEHIRTLGADTELQATIRASMDGSLPLDRPLKKNEPRKLNPSSVQVVILRMLGYRRKEAAALTGYTEAGVGLVLRHPYAQRIMAHGITGSIQSLMDVRGRLQRRAPDMLDVAEDIAEDEDAKPETRLKAAFGLLDRAGYGAVQKQEVDKKVSGQVNITNERAQLLATAIREANGESQEAEVTEIVGSGTEGSASGAEDDGVGEHSEPEGRETLKALPAVGESSSQDNDSGLDGSDSGGQDSQDH